MMTRLLLLVVCVAGPGDGPLSPSEALKRMRVPDDLEVDLVLAEPRITQPVFFDFDERGRLWVVQYLQYPEPAGLKVVSRDVQARIIFDRVPAAPGTPGFVPGRDKITIHEDADGDGVYEKDKTFVEGLNLVTSVLRAEGGAWVLNPPYLLFYADRDGDDRADGAPEVHLEGFGLEDTHAIANSLRWGPDGWIYGAQGSTVTGKVKRPGRPDNEAISSMGQLVWRYHPTRRVYEIFAEGGGNAFGLEFDSKGRLFSGNNGGDSRGFHYVQGGYYSKGFNEHGALSNPHAYGYFGTMKHHPVKRFTHTFVIYEGGTLPPRYRGKILAPSPLLDYVMTSDLQPLGSTFKTWDVAPILSADDPWFAPVDVRVGPDGALYIADWYDHKLHYYNSYGEIDRERGRLYRVRAKGGRPVAPFDLSKKTSEELVALLGHENKGYRQTALRLLGERKDRSVVPILKQNLTLESFWALALLGESVNGLDHQDPLVRAWAVRLAADAGKAAGLEALAAREAHPEVRSQLACSARRLPVDDALPILRGLVTRDADAADPHIPLLVWWAIEAKIRENPGKVLAFVESNAEFWSQPLARQHILGRLVRRYATGGRGSDFLLCARLFRRAPADLGRTLLDGFEKAFEGRPLPPLPEELASAMAPAGGSLVLDLRRGDAAAVDQALEIVKNPSNDPLLRRRTVQVLGEINQPRSVPALLDRARRDKDPEIRKASLAALQRYDREEIGREISESYASFTGLLRDAAAGLLATRPGWSLALLNRVKPADVPA
jgi:putative membrane-bound dehydrogenase-like protein